ncbi:MAG TPA: ferritin family protein [candidate division Zixibacteria bacterium]|nr:ferritin family protein [candidate division Zixibacteria bacterium]
MNIFDFAMQMENDGKSFYKKKAQETKHADLKKILLMLAEEEQKHYNFFKQLKEGKTEQAEKTVEAGSETLDRVKNIFVDMSNAPGARSFGDDELTTWNEAMKIEEKAVAFYSEKASEEADENQKRLLMTIANEERNHVHMIDGVLSYLKFPENFADSAQFKNFQSLEGH